MGIDLTFAIPQWERCPPPLLYTRIALDRDYEMQSAVTALEPLRLTEPVLWYEDEGLKERIDDAYGEPLTFLLCGHLGKLKNKLTLSDWNRAAFDLVSSLPIRQRVILWWH